jgi:xylulose-5-phosphate/fructose-6-phosphate phosphoketolase
MQTNQKNVTDKPLTPELLGKINAYRRAANYLSVGQIYLYDNPLLKEPLKLSHVKPLVVGHWGTTPGQNFIYVHLNRVIKKYDLDMFYIAGPGHGGPALVRTTSTSTVKTCRKSATGSGVTLNVFPATRKSGGIAHPGGY